MASGERRARRRQHGKTAEGRTNRADRMMRGGQGFGTGSSSRGWRRGSDSDAIDDTGPIDVTAVHRDDQLIDAIVGDGPVFTDNEDEYQLAMLLANWREEVLNPPMPEEPDLDTIVSAVNQEIGARQMWLATQRSRRTRLRVVRPIAGAAAAVAVISGLTTAFSYSAQPGDPLWKVKQVVFSEQADSTMAQVDASNELDEAQRAITQGDLNEAKSNLNHAAGRVNSVTDSFARDQLRARLSQLNTMARQPAPTTPTEPPSSDYSPHPSTPGHPSTSPTPDNPFPQLPGMRLPTLPLPSLPAMPTLPPFQLPRLPLINPPGRSLPLEPPAQLRLPTQPVLPAPAPPPGTDKTG